MAVKNKNMWILIVFIFSGLVIGGLIGELAKNVDWLWWLGFGQEFGIENPLELNLGVMAITFGLVLKINVASIIGVMIAIFIDKKFF